MGFNSRVFARIIGLVALGLLAFVALFGGSLQAQAGVSARLPGSDPTGKIDKQVLKDTANGQKTSFAILLADQADVSAAYAMKDQDARGWYVYNTLRDQAAKTQGPIRAALTAAGASYQSYWAANMIVATGDLNLVQSLAARPDVRVIESNKSFKGIEDPAIANYQPAPVGPNTTEWGVNNVNAPAVWALGYTGQGIVVANEDTGMRWTHNALKPKYRGWNGITADHNYNWWDAIHDSIGNPCGNNSQQPCDDQGHGTHTTGTTVGDDGTGNQIGVAPGAKWIGCRNMDANNGTPARYTECFQFFIAPTDLNGQNPNPALRPHVINNSWECPPSEGCAQNSLEVIVNNTQAAGIFVEASAQNSGPGCSTVQNPTAIYSAVFSTGAIDINNTLAGFSSRGPSLYYNPPLLKPNISAPGVNNRSSYYTSDSSYANLSGTSMAGPHVVGVVALIWSARPSLVRDITATKELLQNTANPNVVVNPVQTCGGIPSSQIPNNSFGYGRVDALAAYNASGGTSTPTVLVPTNTRTSTPTNTSIAATATRTNTPMPPTATSTNTPMPPTATHTNTPIAPTSTSTATASSTSQPIDLVPQFYFDWDGGGGGCAASAQPATFGFFLTTENTYGGSVPVTTTMRSSGPQNTSMDIPVPPFTGSYTYNYVCNGPVPCPVSGQPTYTLTVDVNNVVVETNENNNTLTQSISTPPTGTPCPPTHTSTPTSTAVSSTATSTATSAPSVAPTNTALTPVPTDTPGTPSATPTECILNFVDVHPGDWFYDYVKWMYCNNIITGYHTVPPCGQPNESCFKPNNSSTRAQISKMVVLGFNVPINTTGGPHFQDVAVGSTFYEFIETLYNKGAVNGYPCGGGPYPCIPPRNLPYFLPNVIVTRGQLTKILVLGASIPIITPERARFEDVEVGSTFYSYVETLVNLGSIHGYPCGGPAEPCDVESRPYFRPGNNVTRAKLSQIVYLSQPPYPR